MFFHARSSGYSQLPEIASPLCGDFLEEFEKHGLGLRLSQRHQEIFFC
jgi:hypothetical protein